MKNTILLVMHGNEVQTAIFPIDTAHKLADLTLEFRAVSERRRRDLYEHDIAYPLGVVLQ